MAPRASGAGTSRGGRPRGRRNADFDSTRAALVRALRRRLAAPDGGHASFRDLAAAAEVSVATLRHYFASREGAIAAVLASHRQEGLAYLHEVAAGPLRPVRESLRRFVALFLDGYGRGAGDIHALGLVSGLREPRLGPAYITEVLEPILQALEARLARHMAAGELRAADARIAALALLSPLLLAAMHQQTLGGAEVRPLALAKLATAHIDGFLRAYGAPRRT